MTPEWSLACPKWFLAITCTIWHHLEFWRRGFAWFFGPHLFGFGSQGQTLGPGDKIGQKTLFWAHFGPLLGPGGPIFKKKNVDKAALLTWGHGLGHGQGHGPWPWPMAMAQFPQVLRPGPNYIHQLPIHRHRSAITRNPLQCWPIGHGQAMAMPWPWPCHGLGHGQGHGPKLGGLVYVRFFLIGPLGPKRDPKLDPK